MRAARLLLLAAIVAGAVGLFVWWWRPDHKVIIVGDSISVRTTDAYEAAFDRDDVSVQATDGITISGQLEGIAKAVADRPDALVIELGTNDMGNWPDSIPDQVTLVLEEAKVLRCVVWVTVRSGSSNDAAFNDLLRSEAEARGYVDLVDWATFSAGHPEWFAPGDGIHPVADGQQALAAAVHDAVSKCLS